MAGTGPMTSRVYTAQAPVVAEVLEREGVCHCRADMIQKKYGNCAPGFLTAYEFLAERAQAFVPRPKGAELPYWVFPDRRLVDQSAHTLVLDVPEEQILLFRLDLWNRVLQLRYIGKDRADTAAFEREMARQGLNTVQVMTTAFYPQWKQRIFESWERLLLPENRMDPVKQIDLQNVQGMVWELRREWLVRPAAESLSAYV